MKYFSILFIVGCATAIEFDFTFNKRIYHFCSPKEVDNYVGKVCSRVCKRKFFKKKCEVDILDLSEKINHDKFLSSGHLIMPRD